ncbi:unnamed protein product [Fraxinus pennsylvanica]|uniref:Uncharacterized protein n=1 Tax=Fraxinus pennsylvanica TaxID=56036 RepID=A0AAD1ZWR9_9LAMI|nr:unnamed protein product [Fraxinus pennsylvanica]
MAFWRKKNGTQKVHASVVSLSMGSDNYRNFHGRDREYLQARREFLSSYQLSEGNRLKEKIKRFLGGVRETTMAAVAAKRKKIFGIRAYKFTLTWPTEFVIRCFVPGRR